MKKFVVRYKFFLILLAVNISMMFINPVLGKSSFSITKDNMLEMLSVIPPIFILLGLLDVWVQKETMIKLMGEKSGLLGIGIAFFMGSAAAGPLYAAFPIAGILLKKGSKLSNVLIFIGAWSTTKIPMLLFEASSMGWEFTVTRFLINIPGILLIAFLIEKLLVQKDKDMIYKNAIES
ncbi:MAG TPA: permease [Patescibacteria group bacterium]|nr:permease [Patescibacteria group bacterium]